MMVAKFKELSSLPSIHGVVDVTQIHTQKSEYAPLHKI
jgi:hypothetical protein